MSSGSKPWPGVTIWFSAGQFSGAKIPLTIHAMCGRYAAILPAESIAALFQTIGPLPNWAGTWNMAPTRDAPVIRRHPETGERHLGLLRWGLVPHWIKDLKEARQPINARGET